MAEKADLVVAMVDATEAKLGLDIVQQVLKRKDLEAQRVMLVLNKLDLVDEKAVTKLWRNKRDSNLVGRMRFHA